MGFKVELVENPRERKERLDKAIADLEKDGYTVTKQETLTESLLAGEVPDFNQNALKEAKLLLGIVKSLLVQQDQLTKQALSIVNNIEAILEQVKL